MSFESEDQSSDDIDDLSDASEEIFDDIGEEVIANYSSAESSEEENSESTGDTSDSDSDEYDSSGSKGNDSDELETDQSEETTVTRDIDEELEDMLAPVDEIKPVKVSDSSTCVKFSPKQKFFCISSVNGDLEFFSWKQKIVTKLTKVECFEYSSVADIDFSNDGRHVFAVSSSEGFAIIDTDTRRMTNFSQFESSNSITCLRTLNENCVCTGDDKGNLKIWDIRQIRPSSVPRPHRVGCDSTGDYISDIKTKPSVNKLACSSGVGAITIFDMRSLKMQESNNYGKSDITSLISVRNDDVLVAGTLNGHLLFVPWQDTGNSHFFEAVPGAECYNVMELANSAIVTTWDDGLLRVYSIFPHKLIGVLGKQPLPPEHSDISPKQDLVASVGFDRQIHLWSVDEMQGLNDFKKKNKKSSEIKSGFFDELDL